MYVFEYMVYHLKPYGISSNLVQTIKPSVDQSDARAQNGQSNAGIHTDQSANRNIDQSEAKFRKTFEEMHREQQEEVKNLYNKQMNAKYPTKAAKYVEKTTVKYSNSQLGHQRQYLDNNNIVPVDSAPVHNAVPMHVNVDAIVKGYNQQKQVKLEELPEKHFPSAVKNVKQNSEKVRDRRNAGGFDQQLWP